MAVLRIKTDDNGEPVAGTRVAGSDTICNHHEVLDYIEQVYGDDIEVLDEGPILAEAAQVSADAARADAERAARVAADGAANAAAKDDVAVVAEAKARVAAEAGSST